MKNQGGLEIIEQGGEKFGAFERYNENLSDEAISSHDIDDVLHKLEASNIAGCESDEELISEVTKVLPRQHLDADRPFPVVALNRVLYMNTAKAPSPKNVRLQSFTHGGMPNYRWSDPNAEITWLRLMFLEWISPDPFCPTVKDSSYPFQITGATVDTIEKDCPLPLCLGFLVSSS